MRKNSNQHYEAVYQRRLARLRKLGCQHPAKIFWHCTVYNRSDVRERQLASMALAIKVLENKLPIVSLYK